ncbi:MAG TPA: protein kinase [Thermoanaerobaculia bacterium]|nr:protein kinase [Thermoanaerobaculia bacterium]
MPFHCIHCKSEIDPKFKACPFCGEAVTDFMRRYTDAAIDGKYQVLDRLGAGGMGEVYKALHIHLNSIRVIKLMRSQIATDPGAHERFLREARLATRINHPSVATLFDFSTLDDGTNYMVWEYIEGHNLHELLDQRGPLSPRYAARLAAQALHGLDAIHRAGIIHRDISPENIMVTRDDEGQERVKIIDLGIAKKWGEKTEEADRTKTGMFVGKWKYCSPEHLGMLPAGERIDGRADLYSFGIVLYEMLTGVPPFQADTPHAFLVMHASERPRALREVNPSVTDSPELEAIIFRALEKDRTKRFATAREFANALEALASSLSDAHGAPPPLPSFAEMTDEATREAPGPASEAMTVRSIAQDAPTVITKEIQHVHVGAAGASPAESARETGGRGRPPLHWFAAAIVIVAIAIGVFMWRKPAPVVTAAAAAPVQANVISTAPGRLGINAFPWANVTSIRNVESGQPIDIDAGLVTPAPVDLAPGRYEVTLSNPAFRAPITRTVDVAPGAEATLNVQFTDPAQVSLPSFGAKR